MAKKRRPPERAAAPEDLEPSPAPPAPPSLEDLIRKHTAAVDAGQVPVVMALAGVTPLVQVNAAVTPLATTPPNLLDLTFDNPVVGVTTPAQMAAWKGNLKSLLPQFALQIDDIPERPDLPIREVVRFVTALIGSVALSFPTISVAGPIAEGQRRVADRFGSAFAQKCSPELLGRICSGMWETVGSKAGPAVVLEFKEAAKAAAVAVGSGQVVDAPRSRQDGVQRRQDAFLKMVSPLRLAVEKEAGAGAVRICWLNSTMRVEFARAVTDIAGHSSVTMVDLPRRIRREMHVVTQTVGVQRLRKRLSITGKGVRVAVIDGEVDVNHPALTGHVTLQENFTEEGFGNPEEHATAIAGLIAARHEDYGGVAPDATILNYKVFRSKFDDEDEFCALEAVEHALRDGAHVANCSWGIGRAGNGSGRDARAFDNAWSHGLVLVKSAGNEGPSPNTMTAPSDADGVIVVAATDREGKSIAAYSSRGPTPNGKHPHVAAPGGTEAAGIETCLMTGAFGAAGCGTSLAAPLISGAVALLFERHPDLSPDAARQNLITLCRELDGPNPDLYGAGLIDLSALD